MLIVENRAIIILYNFLKNTVKSGKFLLPANICPIVPATFLKAKIDFDFIDIDTSHAMDQLCAIKRVKQDPKITGILFVHAYGYTFDTNSFYENLKQQNSQLYIIDDRCLCSPDLNFIHHENVDLELYSTGCSKYIELSYGGWGLLNDKYKYIRSNLPYSSCDYERLMTTFKSFISSKSRYFYMDSNWLNTSSVYMNEHDYFSLIKSKKEDMDIHKKEINSVYDNELPNNIKLGSDYIDWRYIIKVNKRDEILNAIFRANLFAGTNFPSVAYLFKGENMLEAETEQESILNLFNDHRVDVDFAFKVCQIINSFL